MDKDKILERSRAEKNDEGMEQAQNKGRKVGLVAFCCMFILIVFINLFRRQNIYAPMAMFWAFVAAEAYPKYKFSSKKSFLATTVAGTIASIASLISYVML